MPSPTSPLERYLRLAMGNDVYEMAQQPARRRSAKRQDRERRRTVNQALGHPAKKRGEPRTAVPGG